MTLIKPEFRSFSNDSNIYQGLIDLQSEGYRPLYLPQIINLILENKNLDLLRETYCTPGVRIENSKEHGEDIIIVAHVPNYFSDPKNLRECKDIKNGAGAYPEEEAYRLLKLENRIDVSVLRDQHMNVKSGLITLEEASKDSYAKALIGPRIDDFLERYYAVFGNRIEIYRKNYTDTVKRAKLIAMNLHRAKEGELPFGSFGGSHIGKGGTFLGKIDYNN